MAKSAKQALERKVQQALKGVPIGQIIKATFQRMEVAEQVLRQFGLTKHEKAFLLLMPSAIMRDPTLDERVYLMHAREICRRILAHEDTRPGTDAEVLLAVMNVATKAPLKPQYVILAETVYERVFGDPAVFTWPCNVEELLAEVRAITAVKERVL